MKNNKRIWILSENGRNDRKYRLRNAIQNGEHEDVNEENASKWENEQVTKSDCAHTNTAQIAINKFTVNRFDSFLNESATQSTSNLLVGFLSLLLSRARE